MNPQERQVIDGIFDRLKNVATQPRDPEAERYIGELVQKQPYATYALAQSVYVQEQALLNQQQQIEELQAQVADLQARRQQPASGGGFLSGLFGGGSQQQRPPKMCRPMASVAKPRRRLRPPVPGADSLKPPLPVRGASLSSRRSARAWASSARQVRLLPASPVAWCSARSCHPLWAVALRKPRRQPHRMPTPPAHRRKAQPTISRAMTHARPAGMMPAMATTLTKPDRQAIATKTIKKAPVILRAFSLRGAGGVSVRSR